MFSAHASLETPDKLFRNLNKKKIAVAFDEYRKNEFNALTNNAD